MAEIIPAILPKDYEDLKNKLALVRGYTSIVQIDICDGIFVKNRTWPFDIEDALDEHFKRILNDEEGLPFWEDMDYELDLMVADAITNFDLYLKLGPRRIIFHLDGVGEEGEFKEFLEGMDIYVREATEIGVAINLNTPIEKIYPIVSLLDSVQVMGIENVGFQGEEFDEKAVEYVKILRDKFPDLPISVDGGVDLVSGKKLVDAGATRLVSGSAILKSNDIMNSIAEFRNL